MDVDGKEYSANPIIIATGARSPNFQVFPKMAKSDWLSPSNDLKKQPKKLIIVGSGAIGVEFAISTTPWVQIFIVEYMPRIVPVEDEDVSKQLERSFKKVE